MKKYMVVFAGLSIALAFSSCGKSSESAYKKAYEKAKSQEAAQRVNEVPQTEAPTQTVVAPVTTLPLRRGSLTMLTMYLSVRREWLLSTVLA